MINLYYMVLIPIAAGIICYLIPERAAKIFSVLVQAFLLLFSIFIFSQVLYSGTIIEYLGGWGERIGIPLRADNISAIMIVLASFLMFLLSIFNLNRDHADRLFTALFLISQGLISGIFLAADLFNIFVMIEASSITVTLLMLHKREERSLYDGLIYLMVNLTSMMFFLFGIGMLYKLTGTVDILVLENILGSSKEPRNFILPFSFMLTGISLKSAIFPLFSWLPKAHGNPGAPVVVSAFLSGLYVKTGIYLFIRITQMYLPVIDASYFYLILGFITMFAGAFLALKEVDIKRILAYSTVSQIGLIIVGINQGSEQAYYGGIYHIINHALFKSALFLSAGLIAKHYGTKNIHSIRGVFRQMPAVSVTAILAMLGVTGAPMCNGSISKHLITSGFERNVFDLALILMNLFTVLYFIRLSNIFFSKSSLKKESPKFNHQITLVLLSFLCFAGGISGGEIVSFLFSVQMRLSLTDYMEKSVIYLVTAGTAALIFRVTRKPLRKLSGSFRFEPGFNLLAAMVGVHLGALIIFLHFNLS
jgi:multicomponent Na+:H+ antiporter subunit D